MSTMHNLSPEQIELNKKWVAALRGMDFRQGRSALKTKRSEDYTYCCLGVACEIAGLPQVSSDYGIRFEGRLDLLPTGGQKLYGLASDNGYIKHGRSLAGMNDSGVPFPEIADIIERNLIDNRDGLFATTP